MEQKLKGKVAMVTGGARGIGRAYVLRLAKLGADVVVNDINLEGHKEFDEAISAGNVVNEVKEIGVRCLGIEADVTKKDQVDGMFAKTLAEFGRLDVLVCNAGGGIIPPHRRPSEGPVPPSALNYSTAPSDVEERDFRFTFEINFWSAVLCSQAAARQMKEQKSGRILLVGSQSGRHSIDGGGGMPYKVAKAGIHHLTRTLAKELGEYNIHVNCISPAWIASSRQVAKFKYNPKLKEHMEANNSLHRLGTPEECAKVMEFLVTDLADYVTGQVISVCGGRVLF